MKKVWICLDVDVTDLEVDYTIERGTEPVEFWGSKTHEPYTQVDINSVKYQGIYVEDFDEQAIVDYILWSEVGNE